MTLKDSERKLLLDILQEVKPYIAEPGSIEELIDKHLESANSTLEFMKQIESENDSAKNSTLRTDLRIYVAKLKKRKEG
nr:hypothetical protein [Candidatus Njordarchaeota archaeon]